MLKHISQIKLKFNPTNPSSRSIRQFIALMMSDKSKASNQKCNIDIVSNDSVEKPTLDVVFNDKKKLFIETELLPAHEIMADVMKIARKLQLEEDIKSAV